VNRLRAGLSILIKTAYLAASLFDTDFSIVITLLFPSIINTGTDL
jgi:hypothetical protein